MPKVFINGRREPPASFASLYQETLVNQDLRHYVNENVMVKAGRMADMLDISLRESTSASARWPWRIQMGATIYDLEEAELCYAPQFGAAKDPVNLAGMLAENVLSGDMPVADWSALDRTNALLLDVREPDEFAGGHISKAINIPLSQLRSRYVELPKDREIWVCCAVGQRAYFAARFLTQRGYRSRNLSGGYTTYGGLKTAGLAR